MFYLAFRGYIDENNEEKERNNYIRSNGRFFTGFIYISICIFTSVIVSIILVTIMIGLPQIKASKNVRNMSTVIYLCHPCIMVIINLSDHLGIFLNAGVKSFISMIMSILAALAVVKLSNKFKIIDNFM